MKRIVLLGRLREAIDPATYEKWVVDRDYPFARGLPAIDNYHVSRVEGFLFGTDGKLGAAYDYAEIIHVSDRNDYLDGVGTDEGKRFLDEWSTYIEDFVAIQTEIVE